MKICYFDTETTGLDNVKNDIIEIACIIEVNGDVKDEFSLECQPFDFDQVNLSVLIEEVVEIISPLSIDKQITLFYENPGDVLVELDLERIEQVLVNLIENAIKFSNPATEIQIRIKEDPDYVTVAVKDRGMGISEENLKTIFDKFSTVPSAGVNKPEGTGLGLAICKAIVEGHDGKSGPKASKTNPARFILRCKKSDRDCVASFELRVTG